MPKSYIYLIETPNALNVKSGKSDSFNVQCKYIVRYRNLRIK